MPTPDPPPEAPTGATMGPGGFGGAFDPTVAGNTPGGMAAVANAALGVVGGPGYLPDPTGTSGSVESEVDAEIAAQIDPLNSMLAQVQRNLEGALANIGGMFKTELLPAARTSATNTKGYWDEATASERGIYGETMARLNGIRQARAADATKLAQQLGANIPLSMFTDPVDLETALAATEGAGGLLQGLGLAQGGVQQAEAFAGQVFPLMQARQMQETRAYFGEQIKKLQDEITSIQKQRPGMINERQRQRLLEDRTYQLQKLQAQRDWELAKQAAALEKRKVDAQIYEINQRVDQANKDRATKVSESAKDRAAAAKLAAEKVKLNNQQSLKTAQDNALKYLEALMSPGQQMVTQSVLVGKDANGNDVYKSVTSPVSRTSMTDPNRIMELILTSPGVNKGLKNKFFVDWLTKQIRMRAAASDVPLDKGWVYGQGVGEGGGAFGQKDIETGVSTVPQLRAMNMAELEKLAGSMGWKGAYPGSLEGLKKNVPKGAKKVQGEDPKKKWLVYWIFTNQTKQVAESIPGNR